MRNRKFSLTILCLFLTTIMIGHIISPISSQMPFIDIEEVKDTYIPNTYDDYYYYVNPPGTEFTDVNYWGYTGSGEYTTAGQNFFSTSFPNLDRGENVDNALLTNTSRSGYNDFFDDEPYPRAVRITDGLNPVFEQSQIEPINLHMDFSSTFLAEPNIGYFGFINSSEPFLLDIYVHDYYASGSIDFPSAFPYSYSLGYEKMTYPIFPIGSNPTSLLNFTLILYSYSPSSLITLTPHPWEFPDWIPTIDVNTTFMGEFEQGANDIIDTKTGEMVDPEYDFFSIRMFNISLVQDEYYKIYTDYNMRDGSSPMAFLVGEHYEYLSGDLYGDGYYIYTEESENATLVLFSPGLARGDYIILFQNTTPVTEEYATLPLILNTNITLDYEVYYTFTFDNPHMMAINQTYYYGLDMYDLEFYVEGAKLGEWISVTTDDDLFDRVTGNMYGVNQGDIDNANWRYIPAGSYAIEVTWRRYTWGEIRFTTVPVQQPTTLLVNQDSIFAIELPLTRNRLNWVNLSTHDKFYPVQRVEYEWTFIGKYNEQISAATNWGWFGNENSSINGNAGIWYPWDINDTTINAFLPTRDYEVPILMIRPFRAQNQTLAYPDAFTATLTVSVNEAINQSSIDIDNLIPVAYLYFDDDVDQYFIPWSTISATASINVNDDYSTNDDHLYSIPLTLDPYSIYNITVYLIGNYSTGLGNWNATFQGDNNKIYVHGGNLRSLEIFETHTEAFDNTSVWRSLLILTVSSTSYLYVDLERQGGNNATMQIVITKLSLTNMDFDLPDYEYNNTESNLEVPTEDLLATQIMPPEMKKPKRAPGFSLVLTVGTLVILTTGISLKRRKE
ncbi:MAG: hypothetical protein ACFE95_08035 [Candidatus Hodarchaeota archaeon]